MNVFLNGGGCGLLTEAALKRMGQELDSSKPLLYIPLAMEKELYPGCLQWIKKELIDVDIAAIEMVSSGEEIVERNLNDYSAIFIGGGNTFKLLYELKKSGAFQKIQKYMDNNGIIFGGSAGAIIFGKSLEPCALEDENVVGLQDITGFDILKGISFSCHYTNQTEERNTADTAYLTELSKKMIILALPEEDTLIVQDDIMEIIGTKKCYLFENGIRKEKLPGKCCIM